MQYLIDTSTCVFYLRGNLEVKNSFKSKGLRNCFISELTVFELRFGAENSESPIQSHKSVDRFIKGLSIIPIFGSVEKYAETKVYLRKNGTPMHDEFDLIIGVTALTNQLVLVTDNVKDFRFIKQLEIENWVRPGKESH